MSEMLKVNTTLIKLVLACEEESKEKENKKEE